MIKRTPAHDDRLSTAESWVDGIAVLSVRDAVDMLSAPQLSEAIGAALAKAPVALIVDLTDVDFLASVGMSVLVEAQEQASAISVQFGVVADGAATSRPIKLLGIDSVLALYPALDDAVRDMR
jgi:anti-anti-sigma factor